MSAAETNLRALRAQLVERLRDLRDRSQTTADNRRPVELDQTSVGRVSRMDAMQGQAMAVATEQRRHDEARRIEAAIKRIEVGEYGYCTACGEEIAEKRLAADPTVATCIKCAGG
ncbi:TraR/DksA family transcriptional regulator [Methyloceanibacter caenitepidi]|uniref:DnaK suppressor protein n=1 Tax=Methyloceanibacter caenitepidi TaxID=1384459 RepID=A0A0A8K8F3_9HYPH|nr:TraR/DksA family transcriptional regulator [Methyloceanibacter caenitepidi]BAQ18807.1 DnaK suppressor protein [Methyloceanibacter caenitepidi]